MVTRKPINFGGFLLLIDNYKIYKSDLILSDPKNAKLNCEAAIDFFKATYGKNEDSTISHDKYNIFSLTSSNMFFYNLYKEIRTCIFDFVGDKEPLWISAWLNAHDKDSVLDWHYHEGQYHGYVVFDKHYDECIKTRTIFKNWEIHNELGNIYIGKGGFDHKVVVDQVGGNFSGIRHTLAFQVNNEKNKFLHNSYYPLI
jgi:hypothetical protein